MSQDISIGSRPIGPGHPCYIVAEMSANHGGEYTRAEAIVHAAKEAGADAIKLQTFTPDGHTLNGDQPCFRVGGGTLWDGRTLYDLYQETTMPWEWQPRLQQLAHNLGLDFFSACVDKASADFLETLNVPVHKIPSFDVTDLELVRHVAGFGKPLILSTGMATLGEIDELVRTAREAGARDLILLKCTSAYPADPGEMNLRTIPHMAEAMNVLVGLSDHTMGIAVPVAGVALGACLIEKHFTLSRTLPGPDSSFSMEPGEFRAMVDAVRTVEQALGAVSYEVGAKEAASRVFRRSLFIVRDLAAGEVLARDNVRCIRPGHGLHPRYLPQVLGRKAARKIIRGTPLSWDLLA